MAKLTLANTDLIIERRRPRLSRRTLRRAASAAGLLAGGAALGMIGAGYYVARTLTNPARPTAQDDYVVSPFETGVDYEEVTFAPREGNHTLVGWWLSRPQTNRVIVACTGYRGNKSMLIGIGSALWRAGFNVLLFDYHGHGAGQGAPVTLGYRELQDFYGALNYAKRRVRHARIGVIGYSMGASIAIMGSARRPEVRVVVADSPFATHNDVVAYNVTRVLRILGPQVTLIANLFIERLAGYSSADVAPVRDVARISPRPLLLIHGTADTMIPVKHSELLFAAANEPKELWIGQGAEHCGTYFLDRAAYCARVATYFEANLGPTEQTSVYHAQSPRERRS